MQNNNSIIKKIFGITDKLAGACFFFVMALVLSNIILRNFFRFPITGTLDMVGLFTATGLGLALANCEMNNGNIAMDIVVEKLSIRAQKVIESVLYVISLGFWVIVAWRVFIFANTSYINGRVTPTASIPIYPFIFLLGFNILCLCVALGYKLFFAVKDASAATQESEDGEEGGSE
ncbi:MAG: TRAP transporter small permease subunit [Eubacteriaceae bacterium]|nr:TRAP transporter small permease subunit [Eubacteriaceae bacterium]